MHFKSLHFHFISFHSRHTIHVHSTFARQAQSRRLLHIILAQCAVVFYALRNGIGQSQSIAADRRHLILLSV